MCPFKWTLKRTSYIFHYNFINSSDPSSWPPWNLKDLRYTKESWSLVKGTYLTKHFRLSIVKKGWEMGRMSTVVPHLDGPLLLLRLSSHVTGIWLLWLLLSPLPGLHMSSYWLTQQKKKRQQFLCVLSTHNMGEEELWGRLWENQKSGKSGKRGHWRLQGRHWWSQGVLSCP